MGRVIVGDETELEVRRMLEELQRRTLTGAVVWKDAKIGVQALIEGRAVGIIEDAPSKVGVKHHAVKRDFAERRRAWFEDWYHSLGFAITIPKPSVSNREFARRKESGQALIYRPPTNVISYEAFMAAVGKGDHWTVANEGERAKIDWEPTEAGYWFWVDAKDECPHLGTSWDDLTVVHYLLALEEHIVFWHAVKAETGRMLDVYVSSLLRGHFAQGALCANGSDGGVVVRALSAQHLPISYKYVGGRATYVVN